MFLTMANIELPTIHKRSHYGVWGEVRQDSGRRVRWLMGSAKGNFITAMSSSVFATGPTNSATLSKAIVDTALPIHPRSLCTYAGRGLCVLMNVSMRI